MLSFFVELIAPHFDHVVTAGIEKEVVQMLAHGIVGGDFAGAQSSVQFDQTVLFALGGVLFNGGGDHAVVVENVGDGAVGAETERAQKHGCADLSLSVHVHPQDALAVLFEFQPRAAVGDDGGLVHVAARLVGFRLVIRAGRTDKLGNDDAFRAVDDKGAVFRHEREITHKDFLIDHLFLHFVHEADFHAQGKSVRRVAVAAFFFVIFRFAAEFMIQKIQFKVVGIIGDRGEILEDLADTLVDKGIVGILLDLHEVGDIDDLVDLTELPSLGFAVLLNR